MLLLQHMEKHERGIPTCTVCNKQFPTNYKLQRHQQTHQDNFICNVCNATFKTSLQLQKHVETHVIVVLNGSILTLLVEGVGLSPVCFILGIAFGSFLIGLFTGEPGFIVPIFKRSFLISLLLRNMLKFNSHV
jgi:hypothetical protein